MIKSILGRDFADIREGLKSILIRGATAQEIEKAFSLSSTYERISTLNYGHKRSLHYKEKSKMRGKYMNEFKVEKDIETLHRESTNSMRAHLNSILKTNLPPI